MSKASKVRLKLGMMAAVVLAAAPAWAQGNDPAQPAQPGQGNPTGPAAQPQGGPSLTISSDGTTTAGPAAAPVEDTPSAQTLALPPKKAAGGAPPKPLIWAGTVMFFDQSVNSEALGVGKDYQSRNPSFQLWFSVRPRITIYNSPKDKVNATARLDITKELTNSDSTTQYRESELGDAWFNVSYAHTFVRRNGWSTTLSTGPRVLAPTSKASQNNNVYITLGGGFGLLQTFPINRGSEWFSSGRVLASAYYTHSFTEGTTPGFANDDVAKNNQRTTLAGSGGVSPLASIPTQSSGRFLFQHQILSVLDTGVQITSKLGFTFDTILIQRWNATFPTDSCVRVANSQTCDPVKSAQTTGEDGTQTDLKPQNYTLAAYLLASIDYQLTDELNLSANYYNFANTLGPSGKLQNPFYAPEGARFSLTATIGLDSLYERVVGKDSGPGGGAQGSRVAKSQPSTFGL